MAQKDGNTIQIMFEGDDDYFMSTVACFSRSDFEDPSCEMVIELCKRYRLADEPQAGSTKVGCLQTRT